MQINYFLLSKGMPKSVRWNVFVRGWVEDLAAQELAVASGEPSRGLVDSS